MATFILVDNERFSYPSKSLDFKDGSFNREEDKHFVMVMTVVKPSALPKFVDQYVITF